MQVSDCTFRTALRCHQAGDILQAAALYEAILREEPGHAGAMHLLGVAWQQRGDSARAAEYIGRAIALDGTKAVYHNNLGVALRGLGRLAEAVAAYRQALAIQPLYADAHSNLGAALHAQGNHDEALAALRQALRIEPRHPDALYNLANLCREMGQTQEAIGLYRQAIEARPGRAGTHNNLGNALLAERRTDEAVSAYLRAISLDSRSAESHLNLGSAYAEQEDVDRADECYRTAARLRPEKPLWKIRSLGLCPAIFQTTEALDRYRRDLEGRLDAWRAVPLELDRRDLAAEGPIPSFHLSHHGRDNRALKEKFAALFGPHFPQRRPPLTGGKPRVGFLVTRHHEGGFLRATAGVIERLNPERFQAVVLASQGALEVCRRAIRRADLDWVGLPDQFAAAVERAAAARCDVLCHWQVGTDPLNYFLPFARPAAIQCVAFGMHGTTGAPAVDYALSSTLFEPEGAEAHYGERLWQFETLSCYERRPPLPPPARRGDFGLPQQGNLYYCPQRMSKFHPDFDPLLRAVLEADPSGRLVLLEGRYPLAAAQLRKRFERTLGAAAARVVFLPSQPPTEYHRLLSLADVLLDVPQYSAAWTALDAFAQGLPVVTLPGRFMVERYTLGLYRKMGIDDMIARSAEDYVARAVRLGTDRDYRETMRRRIAERNGVLYEDAQVVYEYEKFFEEAVARAREEQAG